MTESASSSDVPEWESPQFSLRFFFGLTALTAVAFGVLFALPDRVSIICQLVASATIPCVALSTAVYGRGYARAFAIGAAFPAMVLSFWLAMFLLQIFGFGTALDGDPFDVIDHTRCSWMIGIGWVCQLVGGVIGMVARATSDKKVR